MTGQVVTMACLTRRGTEIKAGTMLTIERDAVEKSERNSASWVDDSDNYAVVAPDVVPRLAVVASQPAMAD